MDHPRVYGSRSVSVDGRDDRGTVVQEGTDIGGVFCVAVYFPNTGEVTYYKESRVRTIDD